MKNIGLAKTAVTTLGVTLLTALSLPVDAAIVGKLVQFRNDSGSPANDFEITILFTGKISSVESQKCDPFSNLASGNSPDPSEITLRYTGGNVPVNGLVTCNFEYDSERNGLRVENPTFTNTPQPLAPSPGNNVIGDVIGTALSDGFLVEGDSTSTIYTIFNDLNESFGVRNLQFLVDVPEISDEDLLSGNTPDFGAIIPDFILSPGETSEFSLPGIAVGNFSYTRLNLFRVGTGETVTTVINVHERGVPEPTSTLSLLAFGTLGAGSALLRKRKQQKSAIALTNDAQ